MEHRLYSRVPAEPRCRAQFQLGGRTYRNIPVANLGPDGCCLRIPTHAFVGVGDKALLEGWKLIQPGLPKRSIKAKVAWVRGQDRSRSGYVETGVQFLDAPVDYRKKLAYYVANVPQTPPPDPDAADDRDGKPDGSE